MSSDFHRWREAVLFANNEAVPFFLWRAESSRSETALFCGSFLEVLRKGEVLAFVGLVHNLKDLGTENHISFSGDPFYGKARSWLTVGFFRTSTT